MILRIVLIALGTADIATDLVRALRQRRHQVAFLRHTGTSALPGLRCSQPANTYDSVESLFRHQTGTVREADLVVVCSDVPQRSAVTSWALDQSGGAVVYCEVGAGTSANRQPLPTVDCCLSCATADSVEDCAAALEAFASELLV